MLTIKPFSIYAFFAFYALFAAPSHAAAVEIVHEKTAFEKLKLSVLPTGDDKEVAHTAFTAPRSKPLQKCVNRAGGDASVNNLKTMDDAYKQKISHLCGSGKREIAQEYARDVATEMMRDPRIVELQKCPSDVLGHDPYLYSLAKQSGVEANVHICDKGE